MTRITPARGTTATSTTRAESRDKLVERVQATFSSDQKVIEYAPNFLEALRDSLKQATSDINRSTTLMFLSIAIFQLIVEAAVTEVSLGPFKLSDITLIQKALPAVIAYFALKSMFLTALRKKTLEVHDHTIKQLYKPIYEHNLESFITPHSGPLTEPDSVINASSKLRLIAKWCSYAVVITIVIVILGFEVLAFYQLFQQFGVTDTLVWISLITTMIFLIQATAILYSDPDR